MQDNYMDLLQSNSVIDLNESFKNVTQSILNLLCTNTLWRVNLFVILSVEKTKEKRLRIPTLLTENSVIRRSKGMESAHVRAQPWNQVSLLPKEAHSVGFILVKLAHLGSGPSAKQKPDLLSTQSFILQMRDSYQPVSEEKYYTE